MTFERTGGESSTKDPGAAATALLDLVAVVMRELHPNDVTQRAPGLDDAFDRDLGLDSLGRVEMIARIEAAFAVDLGERVLTSAETPRDVLRAVLKSSGAIRDLRAVESIEVTATHADPAPAHAQTLTEVLRWHVDAHGDRPHIQLFDDYTDGEIITYRRLWDAASNIAGALQYAGLEPGEAVALMLPTGREYFFTFFAVVLAGAVPVPIYPPVRRTQLEDHLQRQSAILSNCRAAMLVTVAEAKPVARLLTSQVDSLRHVFSVDELIAREYPAEIATRSGADTGFLQYTSGSTGDPKGVVLTHANLLANVRGDGVAMRATSSDVFVSWLPLYHDMGLIGAWFGSLYHALKLVIMPPLSFLGRPERWLWAVHRYHGTLSAAPNFAFDLCVRRIDDKAIEGLDLSSWRLVANGAEAINAATLAAFSERFARYGFDPHAMMPVYGLAECSVGLTFPPPGRGPRIDRIDRDALARNGIAQVIAPDSGGPALDLVGCGMPLPRHEIRIVDTADRELPERAQGRLQFRGPSATSGYYRNPGKTADLIRDGWLESGDLGYIAGGELFITGRSKDLIIRAGRNITPSELEHAVGELDGIRNGCVAVFGTPDPDSGTERLVIVAETRRRRAEQLAALRAAINELAVDVIAGPPDDTLLVPPNTVLKTSSGKIRRAATRELYSAGRLGSGETPLWLQIARLGLRGVVPQLRRALRDALGLAYAAWAWFTLIALGSGAWCAAVLPLPRRLSWRMVRACARALVWITRTRVTRRGDLAVSDRTVVYVANHQSYLDGPLMLALLPQPVEFIVKAELERPWYLRVPLRRLGVRFVERFDDARGIEQMHAGADALARPLFVFPEGTFKRMPGLLPFHMGAFTTAVAAGAVVVPVAIHGTRSMLRAGSWFIRRGHVTVTAGSPIAGDATLAAWPAAVQLRDAVRTQLLEGSGEPDLAHESNAVEPDA
ncbi:MAG: AMP-binding protein [Gammaproteobacteria bacterium]